MARVLVVTEAEYVLPEEKEWYSATWTGLEDGPPGKFGPSIKWIFELHVDDNEDLDGLEVNRLTPEEPTPGNACGKMIRWLTGVSKEDMIGYEFDVEELLEDGGIDCFVMIKHKKSAQGGTFPNVDDVKLKKSKKKDKKEDKKEKAKKAKKATPPPPPDEDETPDIPDEDSEDTSVDPEGDSDPEEDSEDIPF